MNLPIHRSADLWLAFFVRCCFKWRRISEDDQMKMHVFILAVVGFLLLATESYAGGWLTDLKKAADQAKAENKQLLMDFTGSDWCGWCIRLDREVFDQKEFKDYADKNLVLLKVDFPQKTELPPAEKEQNKKLSEQYHVDGFPTIVVLNPDGSQAGSISGYVPGGPQAFITKIEKEAPKK